MMSMGPVPNRTERTAAKLLTRDEARRIATKIEKLPGLCSGGSEPPSGTEELSHVSQANIVRCRCWSER
jgi:hypothetical protein